MTNTKNYQAVHIISEQFINNKAAVTYKTEEDIVFQHGFHAGSGSNVIAKIGECDASKTIAKNQENVEYEIQTNEEQILSTSMQISPQNSPSSQPQPRHFSIRNQFPSFRNWQLQSD